MECWWGDGGVFVWVVEMDFWRKGVRDAVRWQVWRAGDWRRWDGMGSRLLY